MDYLYETWEHEHRHVLFFHRVVSLPHKDFVGLAGLTRKCMKNRYDIALIKMLLEIRSLSNLNSLSLLQIEIFMVPFYKKYKISFFLWMWLFVLVDLFMLYMHCIAETIMVWDCILYHLDIFVHIFLFGVNIWNSVWWEAHIQMSFNLGIDLRSNRDKVYRID